MTIGEALAQGSARLAQAGIQVPRLEAESLLCTLLHQSRAQLFAWPETPLSKGQQTQWQSWLERRLAGEPLAYILGRREFWSLEFEVGPGVLIPRPETELLVELALERIPPDTDGRILDLGTGSGVIAAAMASERPRARVLATDASADALGVASRNFRRLELGRIETRQGSWCQVLEAGETFELILSNPPYIAEGDPHLQQGDLPAEPDMALVSGVSGLDALTAICACALQHLEPSGWLLLEHGYHQAMTVRSLLQKAGFVAVESWPDLAGIERVTGGRAPSNFDISQFSG
jgi:release factor glutamine methyltransferase